MLIIKSHGQDIWYRENPQKLIKQRNVTKLADNAKNAQACKTKRLRRVAEKKRMRHVVTPEGPPHPSPTPPRGTRCEAPPWLRQPKRTNVFTLSVEGKGESQGGAPRGERHHKHRRCRRRGTNLSLDLPYIPHCGNMPQTYHDGDPTPADRGL